MVEPYSNKWLTDPTSAEGSLAIHVDRSANQLMEIFKDPNQTPQTLMGIIPNLFKGAAGDYFKRAFSQLIAGLGYQFNPEVSNEDMWQEAIKFAVVQPKEAWGAFYQQDIPEYVQENPEEQKMSTIDSLMAGTRNKDSFMLRMEKIPGFRESVKQILRDVGSDPDAQGGVTNDQLIDALFTIQNAELQQTYPGAGSGFTSPPPENFEVGIDTSNRYATPSALTDPPAIPPDQYIDENATPQPVSATDGFDLENGDYMVVHYLLTNQQMTDEQKQSGLTSLLGMDQKYGDILSRIADFAGVYGPNRGAFSQDDPATAVNRLFTYGGVNLAPMDWSATLPGSLQEFTQAEADVLGRQQQQAPLNVEALPWQDMEQNYSTLRYLLTTRTDTSLETQSQTLGTMLKRYPGLFDMLRQAVYSVHREPSLQNATLGTILDFASRTDPASYEALPQTYAEFQQQAPAVSAEAYTPITQGTTPTVPATTPTTPTVPVTTPTTPTVPVTTPTLPAAPQTQAPPTNLPSTGQLPTAQPSLQQPPTINAVDNPRAWIWAQHFDNLLNNPGDQNSIAMLTEMVGNNPTAKQGLVNMLYAATGQNYTDNLVGGIQAISALTPDQKAEVRGSLDWFIPGREPDTERLVDPRTEDKREGWGSDWAPRNPIQVPGRPWATQPSGWAPGTWIPTEEWSPNVEYQESMNAMLPWMSPQDQDFYMRHLAAVQPEVYGAQGEDYIGAVATNTVGTSPYKEPLRAEGQYNYSTADRLASARSTLLNQVPGQQPLVDPDSPVAGWLDAVLRGAKPYAPGVPSTNQIPETTTNVGNRRTRMQQAEYDTNMENWLSPEFAAGFGVQDSTDASGVQNNQYSQWSEWMKRFLAPSFMKQGVSERAITPSWRQNQYTLNQSGMNRDWGYQQPRWL